MAYRVFGRVRAAGAVAAVIAAAIIVPSVASATPTTPGDSTAGTSTASSAADAAGKISSVRQRLAGLSRTNDQLVEKFDQATNRFHAAQALAAKAAAEYRVAQRNLGIASDQFSTAAAAQYEGGTFSATGALLSSESGSSYLDQLDTLSMLSDHNAQTMNNVAAMQKQAKAAKQKADDLFAQAASTRKAVAVQKAATAAQISKYQGVLDSLNAQQRLLLAQQLAKQNAVQGSSVDTQAKVATIKPALKSIKITSAALKKVIAFAIAQVGKPYVWGSAGPASYDCSGLTMSAYQQAGVSLPHSAAGQYGYGTHVSFNDLQPGDLLFFYQPIGHVAMYIGDGMMVSAPQSGENVKIIPANVFGSSYTGATRLIG